MAIKANISMLLRVASNIEHYIVVILLVQAFQLFTLIILSLSYLISWFNWNLILLEVIFGLKFGWLWSEWFNFEFNSILQYYYVELEDVATLFMQPPTVFDWCCLLLRNSRSGSVYKQRIRCALLACSWLVVVLV